MQQTKKIGYLLAAGATFGSMGAAHADTLTITFSQQVVAAPLSPWLTAAIALALTLLGWYRIFIHFSRSFLWQK